jgi:hypothetical protein
MPRSELLLAIIAGLVCRRTAEDPAAAAPLLQDTRLAWFSPFFSGGGYCSEASITTLLLAPALGDRLRIQPHGDLIKQGYMDGLPPQKRDALQSMVLDDESWVVNEDGPPTLVVCHRCVISRRECLNARDFA